MCLGSGEECGRGALSVVQVAAPINSYVLTYQ